MKDVSVKRRKVDAENRMNARRTRSFQWFLPNDEPAEEQRVCKSFFGGTLCLGKCAKAAINALKGRDGNGTFAGNDARGKHVPWNKTPDEAISLVKRHIELIPRMESHYCRKRVKRQYVDPDLTITKIHEEYLKWMKEQATAHPNDVQYQKTVSEKVYRDIFCNDYNLSAFKPKKDQCKFCEKWKGMTAEEKNKESRREGKT